MNYFLTQPFPHLTTSSLNHFLASYSPLSLTKPYLHHAQLTPNRDRTQYLPDRDRLCPS